MPFPRCTRFACCGRNSCKWIWTQLFSEYNYFRLHKPMKGKKLLWCIQTHSNSFQWDCMWFWSPHQVSIDPLYNPDSHTVGKRIMILKFYNKSIKKVQCNPSEAHNKRESNKSNRTTWSKHLKPFKRTLTNSSFSASQWEHSGFSYLDSVLSRSSPEVEVFGDQRLKKRPWHFRCSNGPKPWEAHE